MEDQIMIFAVDMEAALWKTLTNGQKFGFCYSKVRFWKNFEDFA